MGVDVNDDNVERLIYDIYIYILPKNLIWQFHHLLLIITFMIGVAFPASVRSVIIPSDAFLTNKQGFPVRFS